MQSYGKRNSPLYYLELFQSFLIKIELQSVVFVCIAIREHERERESVCFTLTCSMILALTVSDSYNISAKIRTGLQTTGVTSLLNTLYGWFAVSPAVHLAPLNFSCAVLSFLEPSPRCPCAVPRYHSRIAAGSRVISAVVLYADVRISPLYALRYLRIYQQSWIALLRPALQ